LAIVRIVAVERAAEPRGAFAGLAILPSGRASSGAPLLAGLLFGLLFQQDGAEAVDIAPHHGQGDIALEAVDAAIRLFKAFEPPEARRLLERLEIHYTSKRGSWLDVAEIELSVFTKQCLPLRPRPCTGCHGRRSP